MIMMMMMMMTMMMMMMMMMTGQRPPTLKGQIAPVAMEEPAAQKVIPKAMAGAWAMTPSPRGDVIAQDAVGKARITVLEIIKWGLLPVRESEIQQSSLFATISHSLNTIL